MVVAIKKYRIAYTAVPKAACSSVKAALGSIDPEKSIPISDFISGQVNPHAVYQTMRFRPHRWQRYEGWWRFTVIRDPLKRLLSVYSDRVLDRRELLNSPKIRRQTELTPEPDPDFFFQNLKSYMQLSSVVKHHALPTRLFIGPKPYDYDRVYRTDEIDTLSRDLSERTGMVCKVPRLNSSSTAIKFTDLSNRTQIILSKYLEEEYQDLSEYFDNPFL